MVQATDAGSPEAQHFAKQIEKRSGGTLTVKLRADYPSRDPANEAELARDLRAGEADFGVLPARAWAPAGVEAFDALQAPFVLGNYDVARAALAGPAGNALNDGAREGGRDPARPRPGGAAPHPLGPAAGDAGRLPRPGDPHR